MKARRRWIATKIRQGWKLGEGGKLIRGEGRYRVEIRPQAFGYTGPWPAPWDPAYDPTKHSPAALMGGRYLRPNRFRLNGMLVDGNGCLRDVDECEECGTLPYEGLEHVHVDNPNPFAPRWIKPWRWCSRCVDVTSGTVRRLRERIARKG